MSGRERGRSSNGRGARKTHVGRLSNGNFYWNKSTYESSKKLLSDYIYYLGAAK